MANESSDKSTSQLGATARSPITLWLIVHLFMLILVCTSNLTPSALQLRLVSVFKAYNRMLNLDFTQLIGEDDGKFGTPYHLTHSIYSDVDHRVEILPVGANGDDAAAWVPLAQGWSGGDRRRRYQRLADCFAYLAEFDDSRKALLARAICENYLKSTKIKPARIRCQSHLGIEMGLIRRDESYDVDGPEYFRTEYDADVIITGERVSLIPRESQSQVARPGRRQRQTNGR